MILQSPCKYCEQVVSGFKTDFSEFQGAVKSGSEAGICSMYFEVSILQKSFYFTSKRHEESSPQTLRGMLASLKADGCLHVSLAA